MSGGLRLCASLVAAWAILAAPALAEDAKDVKPLATAKGGSRDGRLGPIDVNRDGMVIRSAEELVARTSKADSAKDRAVQKEMEAELAKRLNVDAIDWKTQMLIGVIGHDFDSLTTDGKALTTTYVPFKEPITRAIPPTPKVVVLVARIDGEVKFVKKK